MRDGKEREHVLRVFTDDRGIGGNPTLVIDGADGVSDVVLRDGARRFGSESTCIFYKGYRVPRLRFFFPTGEMAFCGHGTLGAATVIARREGGGSFAVAIGAGEVAVTVHRQEPAHAELTTRLGRVARVGERDRAVALVALGLPRDALSSLPMVNAGTERIKTLVPLTSVEALNAIETSEEQVLHASNLLGSTGLYPFVREAKVVEARQFPAGAGFLEDPATVTAAIGLASAVRTHYAPSWPNRFEIRQGVAMGRSSRLSVRLLDDGVAVGGFVVADRAPSF
jgi:trans-2,3-dihydro-3-hydroxyanthranilate isomerase